MFELNLLARHVPSGESFLVELSSLPSITKLLQDIQSLVEEQYSHLTFPPIPDVFLHHDNQPPTNTLSAPLLSHQPPFTDALVPEVLPPTFPIPESLVKPEPSLLLAKVSCPICKKDISKSNWARHEKTHRDSFVCEGICQFSTKNAQTMAKHRVSDDCLRWKESNNCLKCGNHIQGSMERHIEKQVCPAAHSCPLCEAKFRLEKEKSCHLKEVHDVVLLVNRKS